MIIINLIIQMNLIVLQVINYNVCLMILYIQKVLKCILTRLMIQNNVKHK